jgi:glycine/D-amino acid oxidase-like deaminating enzyme
MDHDVVVVGAGLAGLACARTLTASGRDVVVLEAADDVGGRVRTDRVDGHLLDRGFQILLTAYPELGRWVDAEELDLRRFDPGAAVYVDGRFHVVGDPLRRPADLGATLVAPVGTVADKVRILREVISVRRGPVADLLRRPDITTAAKLHQLGFSERMVDRFLRPLFSGIQLDPDLDVSARRFEVILRMLAEGDAAVPAAGMGALPHAIARPLPEGSVRTSTPVERVAPTEVVTAGGETIRARSVVVATDGPAAARLTGALPDPGSRPVAALWFGAEVAPVEGRRVLLDGAGSGPAVNVAVMSEVAPSYAPTGRASLVAAVPGPAALGPDLERDVRRQLRTWFGPLAERWELLGTHVIAHGQPLQRPPFSPKQAVRLDRGLYVCGDHRDTASIQGALFSGRRAGTAVLRDLGEVRPPSLG